ncbi:hypothetical protein ACXR2W_11315 [Leucobacter sp. HY1908]
MVRDDQSRFKPISMQEDEMASFDAIVQDDSGLVERGDATRVVVGPYAGDLHASRTFFDPPDQQPLLR